MGRTVADVALLLSVLSGADPRVPLALDAPAPARAACSDRGPAGPGPAGRQGRVERGPRPAGGAGGARRARAGPAGAGRPGLRGDRRGSRPLRRRRGVPDPPGVPVRDRLRPAAPPAPGPAGPQRHLEHRAGPGADRRRPEPRHRAARRAGRPGQRVLRVGGGARLPGHPGRPVRRHPGLGARHQRRTAADVPGLDGIGLPDLGHRAPGDVRARRLHPRRPAGGAPVGRPPPGGLAAAAGGARVRDCHRAQPGHPAGAAVSPVTRSAGRA